MEKGLVVYKSKYGAVKKYAFLLREALACDIRDARQWKDMDFQTYDWIVFAGGIYAGGLACLAPLKKAYPRIRDKKLAVFFVGASPYEEKAFAQVRAQNLKGELQNIPAFYGRGAWNEAQMSWTDRTLCKMLKKAVAKKEPHALEPWMQELLSSAGQVWDWTDKEYLAPLVKYIRGDR